METVERQSERHRSEREGGLEREEDGVRERE